MLFKIVSIFSIVISLAQADVTKIEWGKVVEECDKSDRPTIIIVKQSPIDYTIDTKNEEITANDQSQMLHQRHIFLMMDAWFTQKKMNLVLAEGCSRQSVDEKFLKIFNGWSFSDLKEKVANETYVQIATHIPMKLAAKYSPKLLVECADDEELFVQQRELMIDMKKVIGLLSRLRQYAKNEKKTSTYMKTAIEEYQLDKFITPQKTQEFFEVRLRQGLSLWTKIVKKREEIMAQNIMFKAAPLAIVVNGMHAHELKKKLQSEKFQCLVVEPTGYEKTYERLQGNFNKLLK